MKKLFISEKPSVAQEFAKAIGGDLRRRDGYLESEEAVITWCVGHLVTMSYPDKYDPALKKWTMETLPFIPKDNQYLYEVIPNVKKQFTIVKELLNRDDIETIYVCTDSGREGEYIYRLVDQMAGVPATKDKRRVWIDSQTEEEILRGIREAKPLSAYDTLSAAAYLRAQEDYLMGINFSRVLSKQYGNSMNQFLDNKKWSAISVGRVMTCVLGMVVRREQEIRAFVKTPFYRVLGSFGKEDGKLEGEWKAVAGSMFFETPFLYKENGLKERKDAERLIEKINQTSDGTATIEQVEKKKEKKNPPLLFNLAELQNICSKLFKISPDQTLTIIQELYEKKLVTYPRTDARVLSTAVSKEIYKNIAGLQGFAMVSEDAKEILAKKSYLGLEKTRYVNDKQITDHYAVIPTGQGLGALRSLELTAQKVYEVIVRRFLSIFYPPAEYQKLSLVIGTGGEHFFTNAKVLMNPGFLTVNTFSFIRKKEEEQPAETENEDALTDDEAYLAMLRSLKKGDSLQNLGFEIKEGETSPPKRYNSGSMILAMENAGQLIENEELRAQIKSCGIGTSATRAEILGKLVKIAYLNLNKKTQIITPTLQGEVVYEIVNTSIRAMLNPELTASWEKGLNYVADGEISGEEYIEKLNSFVCRWVNAVKQNNFSRQLEPKFRQAAAYYKK